MERGQWGQGPIDIGGTRVQMPRVPRPPAGAIRLVVFALLALFLLFTAYCHIEPEEVGVVQRFGAYVHTTDSGPHLKLPFGVETVRKVPVQRQLKMEFGFRTLRPGVRTEFANPAEAQAESLMLTGDLNVAVVEWIVPYRIHDPKAYLFNVRNVPETFRYMSEAAVRQIVGDHSVIEVITIGRAEIAQKAKEELQRLCDLYDIGIEIQHLVRAAEGYTLERENHALGDVRRFDALYAEYRKAPDVTRKRMYLETITDRLPKMGKKLVLHETARGVLPLLSLDGSVGEVKK